VGTWRDLEGCSLVVDLSLVEGEDPAALSPLVTGDLGVVVNDVAGPE
jgi:hypothetical protein